jgi:nitric oxide reductase subunit B
MPNLTGRKLYDHARGRAAFWLSNIGMFTMVSAFAAAGVAQVYLERVMGYEFGDVQNEISVHFWVLITGATILSTGLILLIMDFIKYGLPSDEALEN